MARLGYANSSRVSLIRSARTWTYWACYVSQVSALPPTTFDSRTGMSGRFTTSDSVVRVTPSAAAASKT